MTDESLILDIDIYLEEHERNVAKLMAEMAEKDAAIADKDSLIAKLQAELEQYKKISEQKNFKA